MLSQFNRKDERHYCKVCVARKAREGTPYECRVCYFWKTEGSFDDRNLARHYYRVCMDCIEKRRCRLCGEDKDMYEFTRAEWEMAARLNSRRGRCRACMTRNVEEKKCSKCGNMKKEAEFSPYAWRTPGDRVCKVCAKKTERRAWR